MTRTAVSVALLGLLVVAASATSPMMMKQQKDQQQLNIPKDQQQHQQQQQQQPGGKDVDEQCLKCLCEGSTKNCDRNAGCDNDGFCGPFRLSKQYWQEAGSLENDFERCAKNYECASKTVKAYMEKFGKDCDGDGDTDCMDFALIHHKGRRGCPYSDFAQDSLYKFVSNCLKQQQQQTGKDSFGMDKQQQLHGGFDQQQMKQDKLQDSKHEDQKFPSSGISSNLEQEQQHRKPEHEEMKLKHDQQEHKDDKKPSSSPLFQQQQQRSEHDERRDQQQFPSSTSGQQDQDQKKDFKINIEREGGISSKDSQQQQQRENIPDQQRHKDEMHKDQLSKTQDQQQQKRLNVNVRRRR